MTTETSAAEELFEVSKHRLLGIFREVSSVLEVNLGSASSDRLERARHRLEIGRFHVVVCGEYKTGKSSLLNALVRQRSLFPVNADIATSVVCTLIYGPEPKATVYLDRADGGQDVRSVQLVDVAQYVTETGNPGNRLQARLLQIELPDDRLRNGLVLVDTPGIGGVNLEHTAVTYAFLPTADALLFVTDGTQGMTTRELEFLSDAASNCEAVITAVTKIDSVVDHQAVVASARLKVATALGCDEGEVIVVPVSAHRRLNGLDDDDSVLERESNFGELEQAVWDELGSGAGTLMLARAGKELVQVLDLAAAPIMTGIAALEADTEAAIGQLRSRLAQLQRRAEELTDGRASWRTTLGEGLEDIRDAVDVRFSERLSAARSTFDNVYLNDPDLLDVPDEVARRVVRDIATAFADVAAEAELELAVLASDLAAETSLDLSGPTLNLDGFDPINPALPANIVDRRRKGLVRGGFETARGVFFGSRAGSGLGAMIGGLIGLPFAGVGALPGALVGATIGGLLGKLVGSALGVRDQLEQVKEQEQSRRRNELSRVLSPLFSDNRRRVQAEFKRSFRDVRKEMATELDERIRSEKEAVDAALRVAESDRRRTDQEARRRLGELQAELAQISDLRRRVEEVMATASGIGPTGVEHSRNASNPGDRADDGPIGGCSPQAGGSPAHLDLDAFDRL